MTSVGVIVSLVILFILVTLLIILSIIALVVTNKTAKRKSFTIHEFTGSGTDENFELFKSTYFYYNTTSTSKLTLSGKRGVLATINNDSDNIITIIPNPNIPQIEGTLFTSKKKNLNKDGSFTLSGNKTIMILWNNDRTAKIVKI